MTDSKSQRRQIENEVVFRQYNERVQREFNEIKKMAKQDGQEEFMPDEEMPMLFFCECSDENCQKRILLKPSEYNRIHKHRNRFVQIAGHDTHSIERVIKQVAEYNVVEKFIEPPKSATGLHVTDVDNS